MLDQVLHQRPTSFGRVIVLLIEQRMLGLDGGLLGVKRNRAGRVSPDRGSDREVHPRRTRDVAAGATAEPVADADVQQQVVGIKVAVQGGGAGRAFLRLRDDRLGCRRRRGRDDFCVGFIGRRSFCGAEQCGKVGEVVADYGRPVGAGAFFHLPGNGIIRVVFLALDHVGSRERQWHMVPEWAGRRMMDVQALTAAMFGWSPDPFRGPSGDGVVERIGMPLRVERFSGRFNRIFAAAIDMRGASLTGKAIAWQRREGRLDTGVGAHDLDSAVTAGEKVCVAALPGWHARNALRHGRNVLVASEHDQLVIDLEDSREGLVFPSDYAWNSLVNLSHNGHADYRSLLSRSADSMIESTVGPLTPSVAAILYFDQPASRASMTAFRRRAGASRALTTSACASVSSRSIAASSILASVHQWLRAYQLTCLYQCVYCEGMRNTEMQAKPTKCLRCGHKLWVSKGYGPVCKAKIRLAALNEAIRGFATRQVEAARELIADGGLIPTGRPGVFRAVSSNGTDQYMVHSAVCNCPAGLRGRPCYHLAAARILAASGKAA